MEAKGAVGTRTVPATLTLLMSKFSNLSIFYLDYGLSKKVMEMGNPFDDSKRFEKHPCLYCNSVVSKTVVLNVSLFSNFFPKTIIKIQKPVKYYPHYAYICSFWALNFMNQYPDFGVRHSDTFNTWFFARR